MMEEPVIMSLPPTLAPTPPSPPLQTLADLPQEEKDKIQRIVDKVVSLGHENDELRNQLQKQTQQHAEQLTELTGKLQKTTGLLYLYQSTLEAKLAFDAGTEYESLLRGKQSIIDELRNKLETCTGELANTTARLLSREVDMDNLTKQQQHDQTLLQDSTERCTRMETACLNLTKQLTAQGFRLRHMQAMVVKEQQLRSTALHDKTHHNRMCHVSTQCVDIIEQRNTAAVDTVAATAAAAANDDSTGQHDVPVPSSTSSSFPNSKKVVIMDKTSHNDIMKIRDGKGKRNGTYKVLTMKGLVKVPVPISPTKQPQQQVQPPASLPLPKGGDKVAVQSPKKQKKRTSGSDVVQQCWKHDEDNHHAEDNKSESAVSYRARDTRSRPTTSSSSSNLSSNMEYSNRDSHSQSQYMSHPNDKHRVVVVTTAAVRRRPATSPRNNAEGMLGFPQRRRPFDDIENNMTSTIGSARAVHSLPSSEQQTTVRKIPSRQIIGSSSKTMKNTERQLPLHGSRVMFDGDYDAQLFVLLDDIEEEQQI